MSDAPFTPDPRQVDPKGGVVNSSPENLARSQADDREWILGWPPEGTEDRVAAIVMVPNGPVLTPVDEPLVVVAKQRLVEVERERDALLAAEKRALELRDDLRAATERVGEYRQALSNLLAMGQPRCQFVEDAEALINRGASGMLASHPDGTGAADSSSQT